MDLGSSDPWRVLSVPFNSDVLDCEKSGIVKEMVMMSCQDSGGFIYFGEKVKVQIKRKKVLKKRRKEEDKMGELDSMELKRMGP